MDLLDYIRSVRSAVAISDLLPEQLVFGCEIEQVIAEANDVDLLHAYQQSAGTPGALEADALLAEIKRRNLDL